MTVTHLPGDPPIEIRLRRSARARRYSLRVSSLDGRVTLTLPRRAPAAAALDFARSKEGWIRKRLGEAVTAALPRIGGAIPFEGQDRAIRAGSGRRIRLAGDAIEVPEGDPGALPAALGAFLKAQARDRLAARCDTHAAALGRAHAGITLRDPRSRWGSCSAQGRLMFSWRLIMAPPGVLDYVAAHEVAHLAELNHSPAFWAVVARLCPGYAAPRDWLRREGAGLHGWQFAR